MPSLTVRRLGALLTILCVCPLALHSEAGAQSNTQAQIKVSVQVTEDSEGLVASMLRQALRRLGDVAVVTDAELPDYRIEAVVLCTDKPCEQTTQYAVALSVFKPLDLHDLRQYAETASLLADYGSPTLPDSATMAWLSRTLAGYKYEVASWVLLWGRNVYQRAIEERIAEIDARCFERVRLLRRAVSTLLSIEVKERSDSLVRSVLLKRWVGIEPKMDWMEC